ncbi:MAG: hypothetical protein GY835_18810 [bacterium]|nr:hypothetical protein [bacterium]
MRKKQSEKRLKLWIEHAHQSLTQTGDQVCGDIVRTFQTEEQFFVILASAPRDVVDSAAEMLERGTPLDAVVETVLSALPDGERISFTILQVLYGPSGECQAWLAECDVPPLFLIRDCQVVTLPTVEHTFGGRQVRMSRFSLQEEDYAAMVSRGYLHPQGWGWDWNDVAVAVRRLCAVCCDPGELMGAMVRTFRRLNPEAPRESVCVVTVYVRPIQTATVWSGPPADPALDAAALDKLMAEAGTRIICGGTTGQIATRLLGAELKLEPRPADAWEEVPPTSRMEGVSLVTEGTVTLSKARERMAGDVSRGMDGATRLARALLTADKIRFIVGTAANPDQASTDAASAIPRRRIVIEDLVQELITRNKIVFVEYL